MYSVINVDLSVKGGDFLRKTIYASDGYFNYIDYFQQAIIRGSSTVNGDSAHSNGKIEQEHNYVSFYIKSIKIKYDITPYTLTNVTLGNFIFYIVLFKFPYKDDEDIRSKLISTNRTDGIVLYSHPECVLSYDCIPIMMNKPNKNPHSGFLNYNKPFVVGPNDYVGIFYYCRHATNIGNVLYNVNSTSKVVFKPL